MKAIVYRKLITDRKLRKLTNFINTGFPCVIFSWKVALQSQNLKALQF